MGGMQVCQWTKATVVGARSLRVEEYERSPGVHSRNGSEKDITYERQVLILHLPRETTLRLRASWFFFFFKSAEIGQ